MEEMVIDFNKFMEEFINKTGRNIENNIGLYRQALFSAFLIKKVKFADNNLINEMWQCILLEHEHSILGIIGSLENGSLTGAYTILRKLIENGMNIFLLCENKTDYKNRVKQFNDYIDATNYTKAKNSSNLEVKQVSKNIENRQGGINGMSKKRLKCRKSKK